MVLDVGYAVDPPTEDNPYHQIDTEQIIYLITIKTEIKKWYFEN